jgi:adenine/guanine/hypoxanthine permease
MTSRIAGFFGFDRYGTSFRREIIAGVTTFLTMAYIIIVNPAILENAGIPRGPSTTATIIAAVFGTVLMAFLANRPFAIAPYMSENAFIAFVVVKVMGYSWQTALTAVFFAGVAFTLLTLFRVRSWLAESIPLSLKCAFATGIGLFLTFIGLNETGIVTLGVPGAPVKLGNLSQPSVLLAVLGLFFTVILMSRKVLGSMMIGIVVTTIASIALKITPLPQQFFSLPPDISPILFKLDFRGALQPAFFPIVLTVFIMAFLDTVGTLLGLSMRADLLDEHGNLPEIEKPMLADALATVAAPLLGTTTTGAYIESAAGIEEGGRTGFASLVTALLFLLALFLAPLFTIVPPHAYGIALIIIGSFMISPLTKIDFDDFTELIPAFLTIVLMIFTYNIGVGMTTGFIAFPLMKLATGRAREIKSGIWVLALLSLSYFVFGAK